MTSDPRASAPAPAENSMAGIRLLDLAEDHASHLVALSAGRTAGEVWRADDPRLDSPAAGAATRLLVLVEPGASPVDLRRLLCASHVVAVLTLPADPADVADAALHAASDADAVGSAHPQHDRPGMPPPSFSAALVAIWRRTLPTFAERLRVVEDALCALLCGALSPELQLAAEREAHKLAGALGTFGLPDGSRLAREMEAMLSAREPLERRAGTALFHAVRGLRALLSTTDVAP